MTLNRRYNGVWWSFYESDYPAAQKLEDEDWEGGQGASGGVR